MAFDRWGALALREIVLLQAGAPADAHGRWATAPLRLDPEEASPPDLETAVRLPGGVEICVVPTGAGLLLRDALRRPDGTGGVRWIPGSGQVGVLAYAPQDHEETALYGATPEALPPRAANPRARREVLRRALARALGPEAQARLAAVQALGETLLIAHGQRAGTLHPLRFTPYWTAPGRPQRPLFAAGQGPSLAGLLDQGRCRRWRGPGERSSEMLADCEEIPIAAPAPSRHAFVAAADRAAAAFAAFGVDILPFLPAYQG